MQQLDIPVTAQVEIPAMAQQTDCDGEIGDETTAL